MDFLPVSGPSLGGRALRRDRLLVIVGLAFVVIGSWSYLLAGAGMMHAMDGALMPMGSGPWTLGTALVVGAMWIVMMAAMMLPSATPTVLIHAAIARQRVGRSQRAEMLSGAFVSGYLAVWSVFSITATALQYGLDRVALLSPMMKTTSVFLAGAILVSAGVYQWTALKQACLRNCRSPFGFVMAHWRDGMRGAFVMGALHGAYCLGCCWMLMLLLFVGGVMNVGWIAGIAVFVAIEKLIQGQLRFRGATCGMGLRDLVVRRLTGAQLHNWLAVPAGSGE